MGKKNKPALGKSIIKQRSRSGGNIKHANSWLHCSELEDDVGPSIQSVTEQNALDDFLATAELAGTEFTAVKLNTTIVSPRQNEGLLSSDAVKAIKQAQQENEHFLRIPRRPHWDQNMTADELDQKEKQSFLQWRRQLAQLQEKEHILLTPFERNLDFWRQLWRVIERSDVVVQIVDARNPLLYRCEDLEHYVTEVDSKKCFLLLINKADFLTPEQRGTWARYFSRIGLRAAFWSAQLENERLTAMKSSSGWDKETNIDKNELDETSEGQDARLPSRFSEMSLEMESDSEEECGRMTIIRDESGVCGAALNQSGIQVGEMENHTVESLNSASARTDEQHETAVEILRGESSCNSDMSASQHTFCLSTNETDSRPTLRVPSNTEQIREPRTRDDMNGQKGTSHNGEGDKLQSNYPSEQAVDSNGMRFLQDSHLLDTDVDCCGKILTKDELLALFKKLHLEKGEQSSSTETTKILTTVGLVGYPNVGKSSTINALLNDKKVPVSATPGRTKHFQTLYVNDELLLCDCPGLVFPSFVFTKAEMILNGILPIDQMRDHVPPVSLRIPREVLEVVYGVNIPLPQEGEDPNRAAYADELLSAYGYIRGFMTSHGVPDCARSARYILKDYVKGKLLYCIAPPGEDENSFQQIGLKVEKYLGAEGKVKKTQETSGGQMSNVDKDFFKQEHVRCFSRGFHATGRQFPMAPTAQGTTPGSVIAGEGSVPYKPWKKHYNRNKREKLRRLAKN